MKNHSGTERVEEATNLLFHLGGVGQGIRDLLDEEAAVPLPEPVNRHLEGALGGGEPPGNLGVRRVAPLPGQRELERLEELPLPGALELLPEPGEHAIEQGQGPAPLEDPLRRELVDRLQPVTALAPFHLQGERTLPAAALLGPRGLALVCQVVLERAQE